MSGKTTKTTLAAVRRIVERHGGTMERDGNGGWECIAPPGCRWRDAEVTFYPLPLNEAETPDERARMLDEAVSMLTAGAEKAEG
jgi:hypothetical protein